MGEQRAPSLKKRTAALIAALTVLAHTVVNEIHDRRMRAEVRDAVRGQTAPQLSDVKADVRVGFAQIRLEQEQAFVKKADLVPITRKLDQLQEQSAVRGQQADRIEGAVRALLSLQRRKSKAGLPGTHLQASDWQFEKPSRSF